MKKRISLFLMICITLGLIGCDQIGPKNTEIVESSESQTEETESETTENPSESIEKKLINLTKRERQMLNLENLQSVKPALTISKIEYDIKIPENASVYTYTFAEGKIYYAVGYAYYFDEFVQEGKEPPAFEKKHNTQIRSYDILTGEDVLIYCCEKGYAVEVYNVMYQEGSLIWEEAASAEYDWNMCVRKLNLKTGEMSYELYDEQLYDGIKEEPPYIVGGLDTEYRHGNGWTKITISDEQEITELSVKGLVTYVASNGEICLWNVSAREGNIHIYDIKNDKYYRLEANYFSGKDCTIYKNWLLINLEDGMYACNIPEGFWAKLSEEDSGIFYNENDGVYSVSFEKVIYIQ